MSCIAWGLIICRSESSKISLVVNFLLDTGIEAEQGKRQEEGLQVLFDGEIDYESDKLDAIEDDEGNLK